MKMVKEKFQYEVPANHSEDDLSGWVSDRAARVKKGTPGREGRHGGDSESRSMNNAVNYGSLPPGADIRDQEQSDQREEAYGGSLGSGTQVTDDVTRESLRNGFSAKPLSSTDENSHQEQFYDEITVEGEKGFLERNNVLDRT